MSLFGVYGIEDLGQKELLRDFLFDLQTCQITV